MSIWACWSFLSGSRSKPVWICRIWSQTTLTSLVLLARLRDSFSVLQSYTLTALTNSLEWINIKCSCFDRSSLFEHSQLLLRKNLWVGKCRRLPKVWTPHYLLRHHEVIILPIATFWAVDISNNITLPLWLTNRSNTPHSSCCWVWKLFEVALTIVFTRNFGTVTFNCSVVAHSNYSLLIWHISLHLIIICLILISKSSHHQICLLWWILLAHDDIVLLDNGDAVWILELLFVLDVLRCCEVWLGLNYGATLHLSVLNFDLRVVEDVVVVVDVFNNFNWLLLFLWLWRSVSSLVHTVHTRITPRLPLSLVLLVLLPIWVCLLWVLLETVVDHGLSGVLFVFIIVAVNYFFFIGVGVIFFVFIQIVCSLCFGLLVKVKSWFFLTICGLSLFALVIWILILRILLFRQILFWNLGIR